MKIIQAAHAITYGDAASNQIIAMDKLFKQMGFSCEIYAEKIDSRLEYPVKPYTELKPAPDQLLIFHFSTGTSFVKKVLDYPYPIVLYYHNITPAEHFLGNAWGSYVSSIKGRRQLQQLKSKTFFAWGASEYSRQELEEEGFAATSVLPIILNFADYGQALVDEDIIRRYQDDCLNILCVGRITPHKKQDEMLKVLYYYKNFINRHVRLLFVGGEKKNYRQSMEQLSTVLGIQDSVVFTGKVSFSQMCTYYRVADLFLCLSEHEGFCVPLVESMLFQKPVFAYSTTAIPHTMGLSGVLFDEKDPATIAEVIHQVVASEELQHKIIKAQSEQLSRFSCARIQELLEADLEIIIGKRSSMV